MSPTWPLFFSLLSAAAWAHAQSPVTSQTPADLARGKRIFEGQCARCHGMKGAGGEGANLRHPVLKHAPDDQGVFSVIREGIPGTAMPRNWFLSDREIWQAVGYIRSLARIAAQPLAGDPEKGKLIFEKIECGKCHIVHRHGGSVGPDLTNIGARRGPDFLRKAILHPGQEMPLDANGYTAYLVVVAVTTDGRVVTGSRINEDTFTIQLRDDKNRFHSFRKHELEALRKTGGSMMPGYEKSLTPAEIDHLISYLASLRGKP